MAIAIRFEGLDEAILDMQQFSQLKREAEHEVFSQLKTQAKIIMQSYVPVRTGQLRDSVYATTTRSGLEVGATAPYAIFVDQGTRAHYIAPVRAQALSWVDGGGERFFSKGHWVSGIKARKFTEKTARALMKILPDLIWSRIQSKLIQRGWKRGGN